MGDPLSAHTLYIYDILRNTNLDISYHCGYIIQTQNEKGGIVNYKKTITIVVILLDKTLGEKIGDQIGGEQRTVFIN